MFPDVKQYFCTINRMTLITINTSYIRLTVHPMYEVYDACVSNYDTYSYSRYLVVDKGGDLTLA